MNALTKTSSNSLPIAGPPAPAGREFQDRLSSITNRIGFVGGVARLIDCEIGPKTRRELSDRLAEIDASLQHRDPANLRIALIQLFAVTKISADDSADDLATIYAAHLGSLPTWAAIDAIRQIAQGQGESATFAPAAPEIYKRAERVLAGVWHERKKIADILDAAPGSTPRYVSEDESKRRAAHVEEMLKQFAGKATA